MSFTGTYATNLSTNLSSARSLQTATGTYSVAINQTFDSATTVYTSAASVSGSLVIDLSGTLEDAIGDPMTMSVVDFVRIKNATGRDSAQPLRALGGATDIPILSSALSFIQLAGQHTMDLTAPGLAVTGGSADTITLEGTTRFEIVVVGRA